MTYLVAWILFGLFFWTRYLLVDLYWNPERPLLFRAPYWIANTTVWATIAPILFWSARRFPLKGRRWRFQLLMQLVISVVIALIAAAVVGCIVPHPVKVWMAQSRFERFTAAVVAAFPEDLFTSWLLIGGWQAAGYYRAYHERQRQALELERRAAERRMRLKQTHLRALRLQLQPDLLFNTLDAVIALVRRQEADQAELTIERLADLLRRGFQDLEAEEVPLYKELEYVAIYLDLETIRLHGRLSVQIDAHSDVLEAAVPNRCLQPIVESAVRHAIEQRQTPGTIAIRASLSNNMVKLEVQDDGPRVDQTKWLRGPGRGFASERASLRRLYGKASRLRVQNLSQGGVTASILFPFQVSPDLPEPNRAEVDP